MILAIGDVSWLALPLALVALGVGIGSKWRADKTDKRLVEIEAELAALKSRQ